MTGDTENSELNNATNIELETRNEIEIVSKKENMYRRLPMTEHSKNYVKHSWFTAQSEKMKISLPILPRRYLVCIMTFFGLFIMSSQRINLSVAVVVMTAERSITLNNGTMIQKKEFDWTSTEKGYILSSFYYGYLISEFPSGWLAARFGGKRILCLELFLAAIFSFMIPSIVGYGPWTVFAFRALVGILEGGSLASTYAVLSRWTPVNEKAALVTSTLMGLDVSNMVCLSVYGILAVSLGWQSLFYIPGIFALLWCVLCLINVTDDPSDDTKISQSELEYIQKSVYKQTDEKYPWKSLLTSSTVWAAVIGMFCESWVYFFVASELPSYFKDVWNMNVHESGLLLMFSFAIGIILDVACSISADFLINKKRCSITKVRKVFYAIAGYGTAISFVLIANSVSSTMALISVAICNCMYAFYFGSIVTAPLDLAPRYASIIMGMMNTAASLAALLGPTITGYIVTNQTKDEWRLAFLIGSGVCVTATSVYLIFGSSEVQPWAKDKQESRKDETI